MFKHQNIGACCIIRQDISFYILDELIPLFYDFVEFLTAFVYLICFGNKIILKLKQSLQDNLNFDKFLDVRMNPPTTNNILHKQMKKDGD